MPDPRCPNPECMKDTSYLTEWKSISIGSNLVDLIYCRACGSILGIIPKK